MRREEGAYRRYMTDEQRSRPGWIGRENDRVLSLRPLLGLPLQHVEKLLGHLGSRSLVRLAVQLDLKI